MLKYYGILIKPEHIAQKTIDLDLYTNNATITCYEEKKPRSVKIHTTSYCKPANSTQKELTYPELIKNTKHLCRNCVLSHETFTMKQTSAPRLARNVLDVVLEFLVLEEFIARAEKAQLGMNVSYKQLKINDMERVHGSLTDELTKIVQSEKTKDLYYELSEKTKDLVKENHNNAKGEKQQILQQLQKPYGITNGDDAPTLLGVDKLDPLRNTLLRTKLIAAFDLLKENKNKQTQEHSVLLLPRWAADWVMQKNLCGKNSKYYTIAVKDTDTQEMLKTGALLWNPKDTNKELSSLPTAIEISRKLQ